MASRPLSVPRFDLIAVDLRILAFTGVLSILTGSAFGLAPALRASSVDLLTSLKDSARATTGLRPPDALVLVSGRWRWRWCCWWAPVSRQELQPADGDRPRIQPGSGCDHAHEPAGSGLPGCAVDGVS